MLLFMKIFLLDNEPEILPSTKNPEHLKLHKDNPPKISVALA